MSPRVFVPGVPQPQGSKRFLGRSAKGKVRMAESSKLVGPWRERVALVAEKTLDGLEPSRQAIVFNARFIFPRPKGHYGTGRNAGIVKANAPRVPTVKPDLDKLVRAALDGLTAVAFVDDSQVIAINAGKEYGNIAGAELRWDVIA